MMNVDVAVVGGGAAGLAAGLVLARARRQVVVVDAGEPRNAPAGHVRGYLTRDGMPPEHLLAVGRGEVVGYGGEVIRDRVLGIERGFHLRLASGRRLSARRVLVATGLRDETPVIPGLRERWGRDVLHCPYCHGYEVRDAPIGVLGGHAGEMSMHQVLLVSQWSRDVVFFPRHLALTPTDHERLAARGVRVMDGEVRRLVVKNDRLRGVELIDGRLVPRAAVFVAPRFVPQDTLLVDLGCERDGEGRVITDATGHTTVAGVWAAGNVVDPKAQVITAASAGTVAGAAINADLLEEDIEQAVRVKPAAVARSEATSVG